MRTLADRLLPLVLNASLAQLHLPDGVGVLDPFNGDHAGEVRRIVGEFHRKFFGDDRPRALMLGINPGRLGAGSTGLCFTDTKRCESELGIPVNGIRTHEPSSDFFYRMIHAAGGANSFYSRVYVSAVCPLGFVRNGPLGKPVNLNYYDDAALRTAITPFAVQWLRSLIACGMKTDRVLCIGTGKNLKFLERINADHGFFDRIVALEHPRFIMQYKAKRIGAYVEKYIEALA
ncbi:MAG: uracil-DNA glycosylase family protein [Flavobacteriales bacterium]